MMAFNGFKIVRNLTSSLERSFYVTTPIFYVNAAPHIGHLYSAIIADAMCRYRRLTHPDCNVRLCTGTDEHGTKVQQAAASNKTEVSQYCDNISESYKTIFKNAHVGFDDFIRTTEERHKNAVHHFWRNLRDRGFIYSAKYSGWYCIPDETFLTESQLKINEADGSRYSLESGHPVEWTEETNYMFSLSKVQEDVIYWLNQGNKVKPLKFEKILRGFLNEPLPDVSVSRPSSRVHWGIPVPDDANQTVYVWLDALINYLSSAGYPNEKYLKHWPASVHVIGKDILKFHGVYWPAFLIASGLEPPAQLFVHSHWTVDGQKMSKSKNNVVSPTSASAIYSMEGLRYFLLREGVAHSDGNYSNVKALRILNSELADTFGNLLSRTCGKALNPKQIYPALQKEHLEQLLQLDAAQRLKDALGNLQAECGKHYEENNFYLAVDTIMSTLHAANNFFETARPWEYKRGAKKENSLHLESIIAMTMDALRLCGIALQPVVPQLSRQLLDKLSVPQEERLWCNLSESFANTTAVKNYENSFSSAERLLSNADAVLFKRIIMPEEPSSSGVTANNPTLEGTQQLMKSNPKKKTKKQKEKKDRNIAAA